MMDEYGKVLKVTALSITRGYGLAEHIAAFKEIGPCPIHTEKFYKNFV